MPMLTMLLICVSVYFTLMVVILIYNKYMNPKVTNLIFIIINVLLFVAYNLNDFYRNGKFESLTFDQISPFTFTTLPLSYLFSKKVRDAQFSAVAFLSLGMFIAMMISPQHAFLVSFRQDATLLFVLDTLLHLNCSLFGIYLIASGQVLLNAKSLKRSLIYMYSVITFVVFMNFCFKLNYFGMGPYRNFAIYMFDFFDSYWITLLVYVLGVGLVLSLGFEFNYILQLLNYKADAKKDLTHEEVETAEATLKTENEESTEIIDEAA